MTLNPAPVWDYCHRHRRYGTVRWETSMGQNRSAKPHYITAVGRGFIPPPPRAPPPPPPQPSVFISSCFLLLICCCLSLHAPFSSTPKLNVFCCCFRVCFFSRFLLLFFFDAFFWSSLERKCFQSDHFPPSPPPSPYWEWVRGGGGGGKVIAIAIMLLSVYYESIMQKDQLVVGTSRFLQIPSLSDNC